MDWVGQTFLAEEIASNIHIQIEGAVIPKVVKTEEVRSQHPHIINHNLTNANQWYEIKISQDVITWQIKARGNYELLYSYSPTHQTYMTLVAGNVLSADTATDKNLNAIYVMCETPNVIVELESWQKLKFK